MSRQALKFIQNVGTASGLATLDASAKVPYAQLNERWEKVSIAYTQFNVAAVSETIASGISLAASEYVDTVIMNITVEFLGNSSLTVTSDPSNGTPLTGAFFAASLTGNAAGYKQKTSSGTVEFGASRTIDIALQGAEDLDQLTAGTLDLYFKIVKLP